jgi:hypothetical protein
VTLQRVQRGVDIGAGDLAEVATVRRPALDKRPDGAEVDVDAAMRPGACPGAAVEQHQQPVPDWLPEPVRQLAGAAVDPGPDRGSGVVIQQAE